MSSCFSSADILLPDFSKVNGSKWACIACDQFTSEPDYWTEVERFVGDAPSTLHIVLPELYLGEGDEARIEKIHAAMEAYQKHLLLHPNSMIYLERSYADGRVRRGLVGKIDLEDYDYTAASRTKIRATEGTVLSRIPPRVRVRRKAALEAPHVMLLINDPNATVIEPLAKASAAMDTAYNFSLMAGGGHVKGCFLSHELQAQVMAALDSLQAGKDPLLFAVGDGNHSLATAKTHYEELKAQLGDAALTHPARYALVEVVNIHDPALEFEPIYRVIFGVKVPELLAFLQEEPAGEKKHSFRCVHGDSEEFLTLPATNSLPVGTLQSKLDAFLALHPTCEVDYIHGEASLRQLAKQENACGFLFDGMKKEDLFPAVIADGALPRKTFSMGEAREKRYYIECRSICCK